MTSYLAASFLLGSLFGVFVMLFALGLCHAAAKGDDQG